MADLEARKRPLASSDANALEKRGVGVGNQPFSPELLRIYYARLFPGDCMYKWLSYGHDPAVSSPFVDKGFLMRREFSFTIEDDVYIRYLSFKDKEDMMRQIQLRQPHKIDIGAIYSHPPKDHNTVNPAAFKPLGRELVFDVDLTDYDEVRSCCSGARICGRCWPLMTIALRIVNAALTEDFGFEHLFWVYSGRRGIHCWVCDPAARQLTDAARSAVASYLSVVAGNDNTRKKASLAQPLYPALRRALGPLRKHFLASTITEDGQRMLCEPALWSRVIAMVPQSGELHATLEEEFARLDTPALRWAALERECASEAARLKGNRALAGDLAVCPSEIIFAFTYPRLDVNVSTHRNHLLKSPFCAHPKTGRVCVPITAATCGEFDPERVPTLAVLASQINDFDAQRGPEAASATPDVDKTELAAYVRTWERDFIEPLYRDIRRQMHDASEKAAATTGDW